MNGAATEGPGRHLGAGHPQIGQHARQRDGGQVRGRIVLLRGVDELRARQLVAGACKQDVAIGLGADHALRGHHAGGAGHVVDHHGRIEVPGQDVTHHAPHQVHRTACRVADDDTDGLVRIRGLGAQRTCRQYSGGSDQRAAGNREVMHGWNSGGTGISQQSKQYCSTIFTNCLTLPSGIHPWKP
jgi:hypothetical protein